MPENISYRSGYGPTAAPVCEITVSFGDRSEIIPALIDSGASTTHIPERLVRVLSLRKIRDVRVTSANNQTEYRAQVVANLDILGFVFPNHPVTALPRPHALIGRDLLNRYLTILDGPQKRFSIE